MLKFIGSIGAGTLLVVLMACKKQGVREVTGGRTLVTVEDSLLLPDSIWNRGWLLTESEQKMKQYGLVDVQRIDPTIRVHLQYADSSNFMGERLYADLHRAYLLPAAAQALSAAQQELKKIHPGKSLIVYDAARPIAVQRKMWDRVKGTSWQNFVSNPAKGGGLHNYGVAVDVSVVDDFGRALDMGCGFDEFDRRARVDIEPELLESGLLTTVQMENRLLLRKVMLKAGFKALPGEWWHFNWMSRKEAMACLNVIE
ncbi:MAG: hypothetical protein OSJ36_02100 [Odoribacter sp.]|nr:hypothetical protein [Odoribacter sp.]